jgi:hypothetical protein
MSDIAKQFINFGKTIAEDTPVYRVFSRQRLFEMFTDKKLTLVTPRKWDDPFENFLAKCKATVDGIPNVDIGGLFKNFYGQCWTLNRESDAMWRIYSHTKDGARVSTTAGRLLRSIYNPGDPFAMMSYYIGSVGYQTEDELRKLFEDPANASGVALDATGRGQAMNLFLKREAFEHEAEVRLLYQFNQDGCSDQRPEMVWPFKIDPNTLFDDVLFDPRMVEAAYLAESRRLRALGFAKPVKQSTLYTLTNLNIRIRSQF